MATAIESQDRYRLAVALQEVSQKTLAVYDAAKAAGVDTLHTGPIWSAITTMRNDIGMAGVYGPGGLYICTSIELAGWYAVTTVAGSGVPIIGSSRIEEGPEVARDRCCAEIKRILGV